MWEESPAPRATSQRNVTAGSDEPKPALCKAGHQSKGLDNHIAHAYSHPAVQPSFKSHEDKVLQVLHSVLDKETALCFNMGEVDAKRVLPHSPPPPQKGATTPIAPVA